ncbi:hypothetical protein H6P81_006590 [Aristolochia fimbriata]|uniref:Uncharacterized protein n=1 Tax=Aristolochia fimbriata TaxID=158543 RepID=A0AAV7F0H4_ARIFI|nr:hypothetical protein H6P81_006590 [Aristolochia fimbriata]
MSAERQRCNALIHVHSQQHAYALAGHIHCKIHCNTAWSCFEARHFANVHKARPRGPAASTWGSLEAQCAGAHDREGTKGTQEQQMRGGARTVGSCGVQGQQARGGARTAGARGGAGPASTRQAGAHSQTRRRTQPV